MSARLAHMLVQRRGMGPHRIAPLARTNGRGRAAVDGHQRQSRQRRRRIRIDRADLRLRTSRCLGQRHRRARPPADRDSLAAHGIPAVRLLAGFNAPDSNLRLLLTAADTRDKVHPHELDQALRLASTLTWQALAATDATLSSLAEGRD